MPKNLILKTMEGLLLNNLLRDYSSPEMLEAIRVLVDWKEKNGESFADKWIKLAEQGNPDTLTVDKARRMVSHYFRRAITLYNGGYVSKSFLKAVCSSSSTGIIFDIVLPLELALNPSFDIDFFEVLRSVSPRSKKSICKLIPVPKQNKTS